MSQIGIVVDKPLVSYTWWIPSIKSSLELLNFYFILVRKHKTYGFNNTILLTAIPTRAYYIFLENAFKRRLAVV